MKKLALLLLAASCTDGREYAQATCALIDESGTYADERPEVLRIVRTAILSGMIPGDHFILGRIDSKSYERSNIVSTLHLDGRPSRAHAQKVAFLAELDAYAATSARSRYTDIRGAMMICAEHLADTGAAHKTMVVFSDMREELPRGFTRKIESHQFKGITILAMNVKRLQVDNADPATYRARLDKWDSMLASSGAENFEVVVAPEKLMTYLESSRGGFNSAEARRGSRRLRWIHRRRSGARCLLPQIGWRSWTETAREA